MNKACAFAHTNIALVKYWGKLPGPLNLPATGSLSFTLDSFGTETKLELTDNATDSLYIDGVLQKGEPLRRVESFLENVRNLVGRKEHCIVHSTNHVLTKAGLASSASAFAALAVAANSLFELGFDKKELSQLARQGSGSASRSIFGGFVYMHKGSVDDPGQSFAEPILTPDFPKIKVVVAQCGEQTKAVSSTSGMKQTAKTSPYYRSWLESHPADLRNAKAALLNGDLTKLGELTEHSTMKMHACMLAAKPMLSYLSPLTWRVINAVRTLKEKGVPCFFTMDAGPHVKIFTHEDAAEEVALAIQDVDESIKVKTVGGGVGAYLK